MTSDNGRYSAALVAASVAALLSLASPLASHAQNADEAATGGTAEARPEAGADAAQGAQAEDTAAAEQAAEAKPAEPQPDVTGATESPADEGKAAENQPVDSKPAEDAPAGQKAAEEKPAEAPAATPEATPAAAPAADPAPVETPAPAVASEPLPAEPAAPQPVAAPEPEPEEPKDATLVIATPGGGYGQAQEKALFQPFTKETGRKIEAVAYSGGGLKDLEALKNQEASGKPAWDLVSISGEAAGKACDEGLLRRIDPAAVFGEANAAAAREDFVPGAIQPCAIGSTVWSAVILFNKAPFGKNAPATVKDLFDAARFPGKRALPKGGKYVLELALIADGVEPGKVYETLAAEDGMARALAKLGQLKNDIVWWEKGQEPAKLLASGKASMAVAFSGQAFTAAAGRRDGLGFIWDGQIYHFDLWAIPKGARHPRTAREFITFASAPEKLAAQTKWFPYGPARISALGKVGKHAELDLDLAPYLPTTPDNFKNALAFNGQWWAEHGASVAERLDGWLKTAAIQPSAAPATPQKEGASDKKDEKQKDKGKDGDKPKAKSKSKPRERSADKNRDEQEADAPREGGRRASRDSGRDGARDSGRRTSRQPERKTGNERARDESGPERSQGQGRWSYPRDYMD